MENEKEASMETNTEIEAKAAPTVQPTDIYSQLKIAPLNAAR